MAVPGLAKILTNPPAMGIDDGLAHQLDLFGCQALIVIDREKGWKYSIPFSVFTDIGCYAYVGDLAVLYAPMRNWAEEEYLL